MSSLPLKLIRLCCLSRIRLQSHLQLLRR